MDINKIRMAKFVQDEFKQSQEWVSVCNIADEIREFMLREDVYKRILQANQPGSSSSLIQSVIIEKATSLGFKSEAKGLFAEYKNKRLRPDFFLKIDEVGIIMEIERGKTNQNNMDLLDIWKCHICQSAHYLFLIVPNALRQNSSRRVSGKPFDVTCNHFQSFFMPGNYINVRGAVVFGY